MSASGDQLSLNSFTKSYHLWFAFALRTKLQECCALKICTWETYKLLTIKVFFFTVEHVLFPSVTSTRWWAWPAESHVSKSRGGNRPYLRFPLWLSSSARSLGERTAYRRSWTVAVLPESRLQYDVEPGNTVCYMLCFFLSNRGLVKFLLELVKTLKLRAFLFKMFAAWKNCAVSAVCVCPAACRSHLLSLLPSLRCARLPLSDRCSQICVQKHFPFAG